MRPVSTVHCRKCGATNEAVASQCWYCGSRFDAVPPEPTEVDSQTQSAVDEATVTIVYRHFLRRKILCWALAAILVLCFLAWAFPVVSLVCRRNEPLGAVSCVRQYALFGGVSWFEPSISDVRAAHSHEYSVPLEQGPTGLYELELVTMHGNFEIAIVDAKTAEKAVSDIDNLIEGVTVGEITEPGLGVQAENATIGFMVLALLVLVISLFSLGLRQQRGADG